MNFKVGGNRTLTHVVWCTTTTTLVQLALARKQLAFIYVYAYKAKQKHENAKKIFEYSLKMYK